MKKYLIIVTHKSDEFEKFSSTKTDLNDKVSKKVIDNHDSYIIIYENQAFINLEEIKMDIKGYSGDKIILYHGINLDLPDSFDVGTRGVENNSNEDRKQYKTLFNEEDKWRVFDEVWDYFDKKRKLNQDLEARLKLLHALLIPPTGAVSNFKEWEKFKEVAKDKGKPDFDKPWNNFIGKNEGEEKELFTFEQDPFDTSYITRLTALRDALLENY